MKFLTIILLAVTYSIGVTAQQQKFDKAISFIKPKNAHKLDALELKSQVVTTSPSSVIRKSQMGTEIFEVSDAVFQLNAEKGTFPADRLESAQKNWDEMYKRVESAYYTSSIKKVNNYKVLVLNYQLKNEKIGRYFFFAMNDKNSKVLTGILEYPEKSKLSASVTFDEVLKGIKFN